LAINKSLHFQIVADALIPLSMNNANFWIVDGLDHGLGFVLAGTQSNNEFIHNGQDGADRLREGIAKLLAVAQKGKPADFHRVENKNRSGRKQAVGAEVTRLGLNWAAKRKDS